MMPPTQNNLHVLDTSIMEEALLDMKKTLAKYELPAYCEIAMLEFLKYEVLNRVREKS